MVQEPRPIVVARVRHEQLIISGSVASGGTTSEQFDFGEYSIAGLAIPTITSSPVTFQVAINSGGPFANLYDSAGSLVSIPAGSGNIAVSSTALRDALAPWRYGKVIVIAQADGRIFSFVMKA